MTEGAQLLESGLEYVPGQPVLVSLRKRGDRYDIDDRGRPCVSPGEARRPRVQPERQPCRRRLRAGLRVAVAGLDELAQRIAAASAALHAELLELADEEPARLKSG